MLSYIGLGEFTCHISFNYLLLPYIFLCLFLFTVGMGLLLSCISVFLRDVIYIYGIVIMIWNYVTPIFYSIEILPANLITIFKLNPLYQFINAAREIVLYAKCPSLMSIIAITLYALLAVLIGGLVFKKNQDKFVYYV